jgi:hypothetical protein
VMSDSENVIRMNRVCYILRGYQEEKSLQGLCDDWVLSEQDELSSIV